MKARRKLRATLWTLAILGLGTYAISIFVADYFVIDGNSMQPTLNDGEIVIVELTDDAPSRSETVVFRNGSNEMVVKRALGLPRERVELSQGDVLINGQRLTLDAKRSDFIPVFDSSIQDVAEHFFFGGTGTDSNPWTHQLGDTWELDARQVLAGHYNGLMRLHKGVRHDWITPDGRVHYGPWGTDVGDVIVECSFNALDAGGRVRLILEEEGDSFHFLLDVSDANVATGTILRFYHDGQHVRRKEVIDEMVLPFSLDEWTYLRFGNVDNHLWVDYGDLERALEGDYAANHERPDVGEVNPGGPDFEGLLERVKLGGEGCHIQVRGIRVLRDLHYGQKGEFAVGGVLPLGDHEYFLLGDNAPVSRDSREDGPVPESDIVGRVRWVVWPPSAIRRLD